jgi:hypothetical protein
MFFPTSMTALTATFRTFSFLHFLADLLQKSVSVASNLIACCLKSILRTVSTKLAARLDHSLLCRHHRARILQILKLFIAVFLNDADSVEILGVPCCKFVAVIRMFKMFLPPIQT